MPTNIIPKELRYDPLWVEYTKLFPEGWFSEQLRQFHEEDANSEHYRYASLLILVDLYLNKSQVITFDEIVQLIKRDEDQIMAIAPLVSNYNKFCKIDILYAEKALKVDLLALYNSYYR